MHGNEFEVGAYDFYRDYQEYTILYQLIRFYLGKEALGRYTEPKEEFDWNECVHLDTVESVSNPTNLQIYITCESLRGILAVPFLVVIF